MKSIYRTSLILVFLLTLSATLWAQMPGGNAVTLSNKTQTLNGKKYYIHIVEQGQTVYAITRAYGLREFEAVTRKDIHFLQVGDTVWIPSKAESDAKVSDAFGKTTIDTTPASKNSSKGKADNKAAAQYQPPAEEKPDQLGPSAVIRSRINPNSIVVSLMMPLYLSQADKISTSKFDIEQRGKITYKSFEFIQFYEGLLIGLDRLTQMGCNVILNVVDIEGTTDADVDQAFKNGNVAQSDFVIALLTRQPFERAAKLARDAQLFIINPLSDRSEIVADNPYVFKCMPSIQARAKALADGIQHYIPNAPIYIVQSGAKAEKPMLDQLCREFNSRNNSSYTIVDWNAAAKFTNALKTDHHAAIVTLYDQGKDRNRVYTGNLLNKLSAYKTNAPVLFSFDDWTTLYSDVDFSRLQHLTYHTFYAYYDGSDACHRSFIESFRDRYKTEPTSMYAGMAHDIIIYFVNGLQQKGTDFWKAPAVANPKGMLYPLSFSHSRSDYGFENQSAQLYRMQEYHFIPIK